MIRRPGAALWLMAGAAGAAWAAPAVEPGAVEDEVRRANALFEAGRATDALTLLESLAIRIGPDIVRDYPVILAMTGRVQVALGRYDEALALFDRVLAEAPAEANARQYAASMRSALLSEHFGALRVQCSDGIEAVRLVERDEARPCPARWDRLTVGRWTVVEADRSDAISQPVDVSAGADAAVTIRRPPTKVDPIPEPTREPRLGLALGVGLSTIGGRSDEVTETTPQLALRAAIDADVPFGLPVVSLGGELAVGWSNLRYHKSSVDEEVDIELTWLTVEGALLLNACHPIAGFEPCVEGGVAVAWLARAEEQAPDGTVDALEDGDAWHVDGRLGLGARVPMGALDFTVGAHWQRSLTSGALVFPDGALPYVRMWLDVGVLF